MNTLTAVSVLLDLVQTAARLMEEVQTVSAIIQRAQQEGRELNADDWATIDGKQLEARAQALAALSKLRV